MSRSSNYVITFGNVEQFRFFVGSGGLAEHMFMVIDKARTNFKMGEAPFEQGRQQISEVEVVNDDAVKALENILEYGIEQDRKLFLTSLLNEAKQLYSLPNGANKRFYNSNWLKVKIELWN